jgi:hypothetical protein
MKRKWEKMSAAVCLAFLVGLSGCGDKSPSGSGSPSGESTTKPGKSDVKAELQVPEFSKFNFQLKNTDYRVHVREPQGEWQSVTPYNVRINDKLGQNIKSSESVKTSPMVYFGMGDKEVEVEIEKKDGSIGLAVVHPLSADIKAEVKDGKAVIRLKDGNSQKVWRRNSEHFLRAILI